MDKKKKRYEIDSKVRVPNMDDIQTAASDFNEAAVRDGMNHDFLARNAKHLVPIDENDKYNPKLNNIKKEMLQLAMAVASEESDIKEPTVAAVPVKMPAAKSDAEPAAEPVAEPAAELTAEPAAEPAALPVMEPSAVPESPDQVE